MYHKYHIGPCPAGSASRLIPILGSLTYSVGRVWGVVSALDVAREFNRDLADRLGFGLDDVDLVVSPIPGGVSVGLSLPLGGGP